MDDATIARRSGDRAGSNRRSLTAPPRSVRPEAPSGEAATRSWTRHPGVVVALFLAALSLRPQLVGTGPLVGSIEADLGLSHGAIGLLSTIPILCMGIFAPLAPIAATRLGSRAAIGASLATIGAFGLVRSIVEPGWLVILSTIGIGIGMGTCGALLPLYVKERLGAHPLAGTIAYSGGLQLGSAASAALAVPIAFEVGGWRGTLAIFSLITIALVGVWFVLASRDVVAPTWRPVGLAWTEFGDLRGLALALTFALFGTLYYGLIAWLPSAYAEIGWSTASAGQLIAILNMAALVGAMTIGGVAGRILSYRVALTVLASAFALATVGLVLAPAAALAWSLVAGYANGSLFPLILAQPLRLTRSAHRVAILTSLMLGGGYTLAAFGPLALGLVRDATGSFHASLIALIFVAVLFVVSTAYVARWPAATDLTMPGL